MPSPSITPETLAAVDRLSRSEFAALWDNEFPHCDPAQWKPRMLRAMLGYCEAAAGDPMRPTRKGTSTYVLAYADRSERDRSRRR